LTSHRGAGGDCRSVSRLGLLIGNRWMWRCFKVEIIPAVLEYTNCSLHVTVGGALSETIATVSLSTVPRPVPAFLDSILIAMFCSVFSSYYLFLDHFPHNL